MTALLAQAKPPQPFEAPGPEIFETPCLGGDLEVFGLNMCVNRVVLMYFLAALIVITVFALAASRSRFVPKGLQNLVETIVEFVRNDIALAIIGPDGRAWTPFLATLFCFILVSNLFGVIPFLQFPIMSRSGLPIFMAILVWIIFNVVGIRAQGLRGYFKNMLFPPGVPWLVYILLTPVEFISTIIVRPFTLALRLTANMIAGHLILTIFFLGTAYLVAQPLTIVWGGLSLGLSVFLVALELLVATLQAYIFTILTAVYIGGALHPEH